MIAAVFSENKKNFFAGMANEDDSGKMILVAMKAVDPEIDYHELLTEMAVKNWPMSYQVLWNKLNGRTQLKTTERNAIFAIVENLANRTGRKRVGLVTANSGINHSRQSSTTFLFEPVGVWPDVPTMEWAERSGDILKTENIPALLAGEQRRISRIKDDSLAPVVLKGQKVVWEIDDNPTEGKIVLAVKGSRAVAGYYERVEGSQYRVRPPNPATEPTLLDESWTLKGFLGARLPFASERRGRADWDFDEGITS